MTEDEIVEELISHKEKFYTGSQEISDDQFDDLEEKLRIINPDNEYFDLVGLVVTDGIRHKTPMLSMNKSKDKDKYNGLLSWMKNNNIPEGTELFAQPKDDGIALSIHFDASGTVIYAVTRGDGNVGKRVEFIKPNGGTPVKGLPTRVGIVPNTFDGFEIRGEVYVEKCHQDYFKGKPLRNVAAGIIKSGKNTEFLSFTGFKLLCNKTFETDSEMVSVIRGMGIHTKTNNHLITKDPKAIGRYYDLYNESLRDEIVNETDGVVVCVNNIVLQGLIDARKEVSKYNHWNLALKPPSAGAFSKLLDITYRVSKNGRVVPVFHFELTMIGDVNVRRATANNYFRLKEFGDLFVGNTVYVKRENDVIPKVITMKTDGDRTQPIDTITPGDKCPCCGTVTELQLSHVICPNLDCGGRKIGVLTNWLSKMGIKHVGVRTIELGVQHGFLNSVLDLYRHDLADKLATLDGYVPNGKKIKKIIRSITNSRNEVSDSDIIASIGINTVGRRVVEKHNLNNIDNLHEKVSVGEFSQGSIGRTIRKWLERGNNLAELKQLKVELNSTVMEIKRNGKTK